MKLVHCLLAVCCVAFWGCGKKSSFPPSSDWTRFNSPDAPYSLLMPGKPVRTEQDTGDGKMVMHTCELDPDQGVITSAVEMPSDFDVRDKKLVSERLDLGLTAAAGVFSGEVQDKKNLIIDKLYPARDGTIKVKNGSQTMVIRVRLVLTPDHLIQLYVISKDSESSNPQIKKCLDSIKVKQEVD